LHFFPDNLLVNWDEAQFGQRNTRAIMLSTSHCGAYDEPKISSLMTKSYVGNERAVRTHHAGRPSNPSQERQAQMHERFLYDGADNAAVTILLAHGAGAPMDSNSMEASAKALATAGFRVARFEFGYMAARRTSAGRKPPPRAETLIPEYMAAVAGLGATGPLVIGGKSMGGRVASMIADDLRSDGKIAGLLCLGYPFHPPGKPWQLRTKHLAGLRTPALICQGTRDEFGTREEVAGYTLSDRIELLWLDDGDHDLKPRKSISGLTAADHLKTVAEAVTAWVGRLAH
jgi:predicted alpha/beta-hydrolase family hydrolase